MRTVERRDSAIQLLLVDLDDTLLDHTGTTRRVLGEMRRRFPSLAAWPLAELARRHSEELERFHPRVLSGVLTLEESRALRMVALFEGAGEHLTPKQGLQRGRMFRQLYQRSRRPIPGAARFLRWVHRRALVSVVTNNFLEEQREKLRFLGLSGFVDDLVTSEEVGAMKPDPAVFEAALHRTRIPPSGAVVLGDSWNADVIGARNSGLPVVWFNRRRAPPGGPGRVHELHALLPVGEAWRMLAAAHKAHRPPPRSRR